MVKINKEALRKFSKMGGALAKAVSPDSIYADFTGFADDDKKKNLKNKNKKPNGNDDSKNGASNGAKDINSFDEYDTEKDGVNG
tara:strand:+ start:210 stop:461 length:252 start_codon:yes stop_codon:yes gene_type:complete